VSDGQSVNTNRTGYYELIVQVVILNLRLLEK
jgi:hypothetical protein